MEFLAIGNFQQQCFLYSNGQPKLNLTSEAPFRSPPELGALRNLLENVRSATTFEEIGSAIARGVRTISNAPEVAIYRYDRAGNRLEPIEWVGEQPGELAPLEDPTVLEAFRAGEAATGTRPPPRNPPAPPASTSAIDGVDSAKWLFLPVGNHGVVGAGPVAMVAPSRSCLELLVGTAESRLEELDCQRRLREQDDTLESLRSELALNRSFGECFRTIAQEALSDRKADSVRSMATERLAELEWIQFAWVGTVDATEGVIEPDSWAGAGHGYLDRVALDLAADGPVEPAVRSVQSNATIRRDHLDTCGARESDWRHVASARGFAAAIAVPIVHCDVTLGVLAVYPNRRDSVEVLSDEALEEMGRMIGAGIAASHRRAGVMTDRRSTLEFEISDPRCVLLCFAQNTGCSFQVEGVVPGAAADEEAQVFVSIDSHDADLLMEVLDSSIAVRDQNVVKEDEQHLIRFTLTEPFVGSHAAQFGIKLVEVIADEGSVRAVLACPPTMRTAAAVNVVSSVYPQSRLTATSPGRELPTVAAMSDGLFEAMTDRQLEALRTAYQSGFFQWPRERTGEDVAEQMGVSSSTFHRHLRLALDQLLSAVLDEDADP